MSKNVTVNLRVNSEVKKQAGEILENMGLNEIHPEKSYRQQFIFAYDWMSEQK